MRQIKRVLQSLALTCFLGLFGYLLVALSYDVGYADGHMSALHLAERWAGYLLVWPVFAIQKCGGSDPSSRGISWEPVKTLSWIGLWAYFYLLIVLRERWVRRG